MDRINKAPLKPTTTTSLTPSQIPLRNHSTAPILTGIVRHFLAGIDTPLHELVPWKEAKKYWNELLEGEYAWSSIGKKLREKGLVTGH